MGRVWGTLAHVMMSDVLDEDKALLINGDNERPMGSELSRVVLAVGVAHAAVLLGSLTLWLVVVVDALTLGALVVPAAWALLAGVFAAPVSINLACVLWRMWRRGKARDYEFFLFRSTKAAKLTAVAALAGMLCSLCALAGGLMGQEHPAAAMAGIHLLVCFSLAAFSLRVVAVQPEESRQPNLYRELRARPAWHRTALRYTGLALLAAAVLLFLAINGAAAFRLFSRGYVFRHNKPLASDYHRISDDGRMFFLACRGAGAGPDGDVVLLLDADLASSSDGWAWLTPSLSNLWKTCVFDRPGYGWSSEGAPPRTVVREIEDLMLALKAAGLSGSRFAYVSHGLSTWNALMFYSLAKERVVSLIFIDPFDPRLQMATNSRERERLSFVEGFGYAGMLVNAFGFLRPFFRLMTYFRPAFDLPRLVLPQFIDAISRQAFWGTIVAEDVVLEQSGNETLAAFPFNGFALGNLPVALWGRPDSQSLAYFATLSRAVLQFNMSDDMSHFFLFRKEFADQLVTGTSMVVSMGLNAQE